MLFSSMMIMASAAIYAAGQNAISSTTESFGRLWAKSILAEYDQNLKDRYGMFAYYGNEQLTGQKLDYYAAYTASYKKYIKYEVTSCELDDYKLLTEENFLSQVEAAVLAGVKPKALVRDASSALETSADSETDADSDSSAGSGSNSGSASTGVSGGEYGSRYVKNERIIKALPSGGLEGGISVTSLAEKLKDGISADSLISSSAQHVYIFKYFKDYLHERELGETYFQNEIEYILTGKLDDQKSKKKVGNSIIVLRNALNLAYLYSCQEKRDAALAVAEILMPTAPIITQALILEGWAYMEARNDLKILYDGKQVPIMKADDNWAISLENLLAAEYGVDTEGNELSGEYKEKKSYVSPQKIEGKDYEFYLKILVSAMPTDTLSKRMMDLIQINMKYLYCDYFLVEDYYVGVKYSIEVNGKSHEFEEKY